MLLRLCAAGSSPGGSSAASARGSAGGGGSTGGSDGGSAEGGGASGWWRRMAGPRSPSFCTTFLQMEEVVDAAVGNQVLVNVQRGGEDVMVTLRVQDLHALCPDALLEVGLSTPCTACHTRRVERSAGALLAC